MAAQLFHLEGPSLEQLKVQAAALYGPRALIVSAEAVTIGGIRGLLARKHYEIVVEVPETGPDAEAPPARRRGRRSAGVPTGIDALLQQAERDEVRFSGEAHPRTGPSTAVPPGSEAEPATVSTDSGLFTSLLDDLALATESEPARPRPPHPTPAIPLPPAVADVPEVPEADQDPVAAPPSPVRVGPVATPAPTPIPNPTPVPSALRAPLPVQRPVQLPVHVPVHVPEYVPVQFPVLSRRAPGEDLDPLPAEPTDPAQLPTVIGRIHGIVPTVPAVCSAPGDLVVLVGAAADSWAVALSMAIAFGKGSPAATAIAGPASTTAPEANRIEDRLDANAARALGVDGEHPVFLALPSTTAPADVATLLRVRPDQVWLVVDAIRKEADTAAWVDALRRTMGRESLFPAGLAVVNSTLTTTPDTVGSLGLPIGWVDGHPAATRGFRPPGGDRRRIDGTG